MYFNILDGQTLTFTVYVMMTSFLSWVAVTTQTSRNLFIFDINSTHRYRTNTSKLYIEP